MILAIRTDNPDAELCLIGDKGEDSTTWYAHRELSNTLLQKIDELLATNNQTKSDLSGIIVYQGPGSFTGLRIGITVANTMAYALSIPVVGTTGDQWKEEGTRLLEKTVHFEAVVPLYGQDPRITTPKK